MRYYHILLVGEFAYGPDKAIWRCYEELKLAGHAVEILDTALHPEVVDKSGALNLSALAAFKRVFKPDYIASKGENSETILAALEKTGCGQEIRPRHFVVFGYVGRGNFGDELIFSTLCDQIRRRYPGAYVSLIGYGPQANLARHGVVSVTSAMKSRCDAVLNGADALVYMAGILFDEPFLMNTAGKIDLYLNPRSLIPAQTAMTLLAYQNDVPVVYLGVGAGPLESFDSQRLVKIASLVEPSFVVRDAETKGWLLQAGVDPDLVSVKADIAFLASRPLLSENHEGKFPLGGLVEAEKEYIVVSLRRWSGLPEDAPARMAELLDYVWERYGLGSVFVDFAPEDGEIHSEICRRMRHPEAARLYGVANDHDGVFRLIALAWGVVAMRLHCSIVANSLNVPSIGVNYNDKIEAFYRRMGREQYLLPMDFDPENACLCMDQLVDQHEEDVLRIGERAEENRRLAQEAMDVLWGVVEDREVSPRRLYPYPRSESIEMLKLCESREEVAALKAELKRLRGLTKVLEGEIKAARVEANRAKEALVKVKSSRTWKVGSAIAAPLRKVRSKLKK